MKRRLLTLALAVLTVGLLGSCSKINERLDNLDKRIDAIENEQIASINTQIDGIKSSIADLGQIRGDITSLKQSAETHSQEIFALQEADEALGDRIVNLEDYLDVTLPTFAEKEWVEATFSTLEQYEATCDTIAKIDARIGALDTKLSEDIKACADSLTKWVNKTFEGYYTAAQMDAKLAQMKAAIDSAKASGKISDTKADSIAAELTKTKTEVDTAKAAIRAEYKAAVKSAIETSEGKLTKALNDSIATVNGKITALTGRVKTLEDKVDLLTGRIYNLENMIQSVTIVPAYSDGSVEATQDGILYLDIIVEPAKAVAALTKDNLKVLVNEVKTKAVKVDTVAIEVFRSDSDKGTVAAKANISSKLPVESGKALTIAVNVKNGLSDFTTDFYPVTLSSEPNVTITEKTNTTQVTINADADFPESVMGNIVVADGFKDTKPTTIEMGGIGTIIFDEDATRKIKANAQEESSTSVFFKVEDVTESKPVTEANIVYEVTMKTVDEKGVEVFAAGKAAGKATVTVPLGDEVSSVTSVVLVSEIGTPIEGGVVPGSIHLENGILSFEVKHFSRYAIKYTLKESVARIGDIKFTTLAKAIAAAQNGNTIQMIADFATTDNVTVGADKNIVLDLNGKKISYTTDGYGSFIENKGQLKIMDSGQNGIITANFSKPNWSEGCYTINNAGTYDKAGKLVIESGTIENTSPGVGLACPVSNGIYGTNADLEINGGTIHSTNYVPVREYLQCGGKKTVVINGGKFISDNSRAIAIQVNDATIQDTGSSVTINGGEFTCNGSGILYVDLHAANVNMTGFTMTVNDGKFSNSKADAPVLVYDNEGNPQTSAVLLRGILKGGIYSKEPASELISFGYMVEANTDTQTKSAYPWRVAANSSKDAEVSVSKSGQTTLYSTLAAFRDETNAGNSFAGYTVKLLKDIDMTGVTDWKAIGDDGLEYDYCDKNFSGIFDGNGKTISNLAISSPNYWGAALFGYVDGTVKNLTISNSSCSGKGGNAILAVMCGGNVTIENCHLIGCNVSTSSSSGLMISYVLSAETAVIKNCSTDANSSITSTGGYQIGGIIGQTTSINTLEVTDCVNRASVTGIYGIGGIIGQFGNNITNATLTRCKNYGAIQLTTHTIQYAGGIAGVIPTTTSVSTNYKFVDCENHGTVTAAPEWPTFNSCTGGMIGYAYQNEYVTLSMTGCKNTAAVGSDRSIYSGGMIGWHHYAKGTDLFQYTECTNTGTITATQNGQSGGHNAGRAGQLVGCSDGSHDNATDCNLNGTVSANGVTKITGEE